MQTIRLIAWFFLPYALAAAPLLTEEEGVRRISAHLLIDDAVTAIKEAEEYYAAFKESRAIAGAYIEALSALGREEKALEVWHQLSGRYPDLIQERHLLEELSWGVLRHGIESTQYGVRLASLIGIYLTHDVRAVKLLVRMMRDSNAVIRAVAIQMAASFGDAPLKDEIERLFVEEKVWMVRLEVIKAAGALRMKGLAPQLKAVLSSVKNTYEERQLAAEAIAGIYDQIQPEEIRQFASSNRFGMRHLACMLAQHFQVAEAEEEMIRLSSDPHPDVRVAALNAIGLVYPDRPAAQEAAKRSLADAKPSVAITAAWAVSLFEPKLGAQELQKWLASDQSEHRRLAAAALAATGARCLELSKQTMKASADPYVAVNVAMGLLGQREEVQLACDTLVQFMMKEKRMWMWDSSANPLFRVLAPSQVRHIDQIPNYPEAIDQMTRLNLVSLLALVEDPRAEEALKSFLQYKTWGITGVAAATLLQEGSEGALEVVRALLDDSDPNVRMQACLVLALLGRDETVIFDLQKAYIHSDHERKLHILEALGRIGSAESFSFFVGVLDEPFPILRIAAASGLIQGLNR